MCPADRVIDHVDPTPARELAYAARPSRCPHIDLLCASILQSKKFGSAARQRCCYLHPVYPVSSGIDFFKGSFKISNIRLIRRRARKICNRAAGDSLENKCQTFPYWGPTISMRSRRASGTTLSKAHEARTCQSRSNICLARLIRGSKYHPLDSSARRWANGYGWRPCCRESCANWRSLRPELIGKPT